MDSTSRVFKPAGVLLVLSAVEIVLAVLTIPANFYSLLYGWLYLPGFYPIVQLILFCISLVMSLWLLVAGGAGILYCMRLRALQGSFQFKRLAGRNLIVIVLNSFYLCALLLFWFIMLAARIDAKQPLRSMNAVQATLCVMQDDLVSSLIMWALVLMVIATIVITAVARNLCNDICCNIKEVVDSRKFCREVRSGVAEILREYTESRQPPKTSAAPPPAYSKVPQGLPDAKV
ncbi:uncharacterized protein LOC129597286 [Paramacrobiotus metropolitanus]|uniref:uncharacterized protein LOC129597286 n=1 Tax=Paramacrobiotus metropolitanus TaxID=2943436 RepID=UPI0024457AB7|nr:uncharacterized protein LOC129597286 [Paramacrobiotus metropolitanus]